MNDGNMATNISPVSEGEMEQIQNLFKKAADTIVAFSSLSGQVEKLQAQVNDLSNQVTRYRNHIDTQDDAMYRLRQEREELTNRASEAEHSRAMAEAGERAAKSELDTVKVTISDLEARVARLMKDRDDAEFKVMELEDKLQKSETHVEKFRDLAKAIGMTVPEPVKAPEPTPPVTLPPVSTDIQPKTLDPTPWWNKDSGDETKDHPVDDPWTSAQKASQG